MICQRILLTTILHTANGCHTDRTLHVAVIQSHQINNMSDFDLITGYTPGVIGRVSELHSLYYFENWGFEKYFEVKVATEMSEFISNYNETNDRIFSLVVNGTIEGSISVDGSSEKNQTAHLRWFIISDNLRGKGAGNFLMNQAMKFCRKRQYSNIYLWTFQGLGSARHLYEKYGFTLTEERTGEQWGSKVTEQRFDAEIRVL